MRLTKSSIEDFSILVHTALRKCCDSKATSIAYNAISILDDDAWRDCVACMTDALRDQEFTSKERLELAVKTVSQNLTTLGRYQCNVRTWQVIVILQCAFQLFNQADWTGYCSYLTIRKEKVRHGNGSKGKKGKS